MMICRKTYRKFLLGLLAVSLLGLGVYDYFRERARIPDSYVQTEGEPGPAEPDFPVTAQITQSVTEASYNSRTGKSYQISYRYLGWMPLKETEVTVVQKTCVIPGGIPVGTGGKAAILISGGLDSPVAAWMMAKRGVELTAIHFASPPYTSERAHEKVVALLKKVGEYAGRMDMITVPFTEIQEQIRDNCPEELATVIMRRFMMRAAERIARERECSALVTGESLGQVASQTIQAIACTDAAANMPVFRPLIGSDKSEIVTLAHRIDTYDISIEPYEDCCTVFTPKHPRTRPTLNVVEAAEQKLDVEQLLKNCLEKTEIRHL